MDAVWFARRAALHCLAQQHPEWTNADLAAAVGASESWVKKWLARLKHMTTTDPDDMAMKISILFYADAREALIKALGD